MTRIWGMTPPSVPPRGWWWLAVASAAAFLFWLTPRIDIARQLDLAIIFILALLALSMSFLWGYVGMLSFGQTAFFGLGGYAYAVLALNFDATTWPACAAVLVAMLFAAVLGYFLIYLLVFGYLAAYWGEREVTAIATALAALLALVAAALSLVWFSRP